MMNREQVEGIKDVIDWERYELTIAGTADNASGLGINRKAPPGDCDC